MESPATARTRRQSTDAGEVTLRSATAGHNVGSVDRWTATLATVWTELGGSGEPRVAWSGPDGLLPSPFPVQELAMGAVGAAAAAAGELARARGADNGSGTGPAAVDARRVAASFRADQLLRCDGVAFAPFAPLSGFWATADGWVRTHANFPHHRRRLLAALGLRDDDPGELAAALRNRRASEVEEVVHEAGGIAVMVRTAAEWAAHPQGRAVAAAPLVARTSSGPGTGPAPALPAAAGRPARGIRVLDLTRVIAGPVATRTLALLGADVLRIDPPQLPELAAQHWDTDFGKRSALLDLRAGADRATFEELLAQAHVLVTGYRPGALARFGLGVDELRERRPDLVVATLSAWGGDGPFAGRRGFDSIVQAACGIARRSAHPDGAPGALPAQALDHATGYLTAAAVLLGLADRFRHGSGTTLSLSLARTAHRLVTLPAPASPAGGVESEPVESELVEVDCAAGRLRHPPPAFRLPNGPSGWDRPPGIWGADAAVWRA